MSVATLKSLCRCISEPWSQARERLSWAGSAEMVWMSASRSGRGGGRGQVNQGDEASGAFHQRADRGLVGPADDEVTLPLIEWLAVGRGGLLLADQGLPNVVPVSTAR